MADTFDRKTRSWIMSRVRSRDTKPEIAVRKALRQAGCRLRPRSRLIPGNPDFVLSECRLAVFVNGCFWHWHGCKRCRMPQENRRYWERKIAKNVRRDRRNKTALRKAGWHYWTVWECNLESGVTRLLSKARHLRMGTTS